MAIAERTRGHTSGNINHIAGELIPLSVVNKIIFLPYNFIHSWPLLMKILVQKLKTRQIFLTTEFPKLYAYTK